MKMIWYMAIVAWLVVLSLSFVVVPVVPPTCGTDTECMDRHGGDGGPEPRR